MIFDKISKLFKTKTPQEKLLEAQTKIEKMRDDFVGKLKVVEDLYKDTYHTTVTTTTYKSKFKKRDPSRRW